MVKGEGFVIRQTGHARPAVLGGSAEKLEHPLDLVVHVAAGEERPPGICELGEDTAGTPHVDAGSVEFCAKQNVRRPVPEGDHLRAVAPHRDSEGASKAEVSQLQLTVLIDQQVLGLEIPIRHSKITNLQKAPTNLWRTLWVWQ